MDDLKNISLLYEKIVQVLDLPDNNKELSNLIFSETNGGTELFTVWTIRTNDSKTDSSKRAGDVMVLNGKLKIPQECVRGGGSPAGNTRVLFDKYGKIRMLVTAVDGENYTSLPKCDRIRTFSATNCSKLAIGGTVYKKH